MTSLPQTQRRSPAAQDGHRRTAIVSPEVPEAGGGVQGRTRQSLPTVDPSKEFGCVDWYLYPQTAAEAQAKLARPS